MGLSIALSTISLEKLAVSPANTSRSQERSILQSLGKGTSTFEMEGFATATGSLSLEIVFHKEPDLDLFFKAAGMFDDDITDLSTTVDETIEAYHQEKYGGNN